MKTGISVHRIIPACLALLALILGAVALARSEIHGIAANLFYSPLSDRSIWKTVVPASAQGQPIPLISTLDVGLSSWLTPDGTSIPLFQATDFSARVRILHNPATWMQVSTGAWKHLNNSATIEAEIVASSSARFPFPYHPYVSQSGTSHVVPAEYDPVINPPDGSARIVAAPQGIYPSLHPDGHMVIFQPDGTAVETFGTILLSDGTIVCQTYKITDPSKDGDGRQNGVTASMIPVYAGLIREREFLDGSIDHAVKIVVPAKLLHPSYVYPALAFDRGALSERPPYSGLIPMGARLFLPPQVKIDQLKLRTRLGRVVAKAAQNYGFIVTDRGGAGITLMVEAGVQAPELDDWSHEQERDLLAIFRNVHSFQ
jgi:hypothetical protein